MCISRWNPSEPCCDDTNKCAACPEINWDNYTMEVTQPQADSYWAKSSDGSDLPDTERRFRAVRTPLWQLSECAWMMVGTTEHHLTKLYNFDTEQLESADVWWPAVGSSWWNFGGFYPHPSGSHYSEEYYQESLQAYEDAIAELDEDDPVRRWAEAMRGLQGMFGRQGIGRTYTGISLYYWGYHWSYGFNWWRPAVAYLRLFRGQWWYTVANWSGLFYGNEAFPQLHVSEDDWIYSTDTGTHVTPYKPIPRKDWNCGGLNTFELHSDAPSHFPSTIEIRTTRNKELR